MFAPNRVDEAGDILSGVTQIGDWAKFARGRVVRKKVVEVFHFGPRGREHAGTTRVQVVEVREGVRVRGGRGRP